MPSTTPLAAPISVLDPILRLRSRDGVRMAGLHEVLALAHAGDLVDLPGLRVDQRATAVTALAIISHLLRRYGPALLITEDWCAAVVAAFGDGLTLVGGPDDRPQFLQPVLDPTLVKAISMTEVDHLMPATHHAVKSEMTASPETALYALMASTWRHYGGPTHYAGARARHITVLVGDGGIGSEITALSTAYDRSIPRLVGSEASPVAPLDHMLWAQPWVDREPVARCAFPFIDCRKLRLVPARDGLVGAVSAPMTASRVDTGSGALDDPHVPLTTAGKPFSLVLTRTWSHRVQYAAIAGSAQVVRPAILHLAPPFSLLRVSGVHQGQGTTGGYWESDYCIGASHKAVRLGPPAPGDRLSTLSAMALAILSAAEGTLTVPMSLLCPGRPRDVARVARPHLARAEAMLRETLGERALQAVLALIDAAPDSQREHETLAVLAVAQLLPVWRLVASGVSRDPLRLARAGDELDSRIRTAFGEAHTMNDTPTNGLAGRAHAILHAIDRALTPDNRARLRSAGPTLPLDAYAALAEAPHAWTDHPRPMAVLEALVRCLGSLHQGGPSIGATLARKEYPEARVSALLAARGETLVGLIAEAGRWLVNHGVERVSLTDLAVLGLADALDDAGAHQRAVHAIALDFARRQRAARAALRAA